tara:strand:+ start:4098 stop:5153 length:1056 start_codon:yes stop_codon:yes gene_type:complete
MINNISYFLVILFFISCEPDEIPVDIEGVINYTQIDLGSDYCIQKYYSIQEDLVVGENLTSNWDIAFSNFPDSKSIILNSSKYMRVLPLNNILNTNPSVPLSLDDMLKFNDWKFDDPNGNLFLTAFMNDDQELNYCQSDNNLIEQYTYGDYLIDKGYDCENNHLGMCIVRLHSSNENTYSVQIINNIFQPFINWSFSSIIDIEKKDGNNFTYFSLNNTNIVDVVNFEWDLCFSQYTEFNVPSPGNPSATLPTYRVVGVLQNHHVSVAVDSINDFSNINSSNIEDYVFKTDRNSIGYDWKVYDGPAGIYSIVSPVYIIKTHYKDYYKLLFLDFYNNNGEKGAPMFQLEKITL